MVKNNFKEGEKQEDGHQNQYGCLFSFWGEAQMIKGRHNERKYERSTEERIGNVGKGNLNEVETY